MNDKTRQMIELYADASSYKKVADAFGMSLNAVRSRINKAVAKEEGRDWDKRMLREFLHNTLRRIDGRSTRLDSPSMWVYHDACPVCYASMMCDGKRVYCSSQYCGYSERLGG